MEQRRALTDPVSQAALIAAAPSPDWTRARELIDNALDGTEVTGKVSAAKIINGNAFVMVNDKQIPVINVTQVA